MTAMNRRKLTHRTNDALSGDVIQRVMRILSGRTQNNALLIREHGVDTTPLVEGLAQRIVRGCVPSNLADARLIALDMGKSVAEAKYVIEFEKKLKADLEQVEKAGSKVVFVVNEIHILFGTARTKGLELFYQMLARGQLRCIGVTTLDEYRTYMEKDIVHVTQFQQVHVVEPSMEDTIGILRGLKESFEGRHDVRIQDGALTVAVQLSVQHITRRRLPEKAIDLVDEACADVKIQGGRSDLARGADLSSGAFLQVKAAIAMLEGNIEESLALKETVGPEQIREVVSRWTRIPLTKLGQNEKSWLIGLPGRLHRRVVGQDEAVNAVSRAVKISRVGLGRPGRPIGSFLFLGPTGVGKTELAKALTEQLFDDENLLIRIDMSKYMEESSFNRLIGAPSRYVKHEGCGKLLEAVRRRPYSVVLFHNVEIAHPTTWSTLLEVLDYGTLTDCEGRAVDFTNTMIIMTSNLGADYLLEGLVGECTTENAREIVMQEVRKHFKPDLLDLLDDIVIFDPLSHEQLRNVAKLQLKDVTSRLAERGIDLVVTEAALDIILAKRYDVADGARPVRIWLEEVVTNLSKMLLMEEIGEGSTVYLDVACNGTELICRSGDL